MENTQVNENNFESELNEFLNSNRRLEDTHCIYNMEITGRNYRINTFLVIRYCIFNYNIKVKLLKYFDNETEFKIYSCNPPNNYYKKGKIMKFINSNIDVIHCYNEDKHNKIIAHQKSELIENKNVSKLFNQEIQLITNRILFNNSSFNNNDIKIQSIPINKHFYIYYLYKKRNYFYKVKLLKYYLCYIKCEILEADKIFSYDTKFNSDTDRLENIILSYNIGDIVKLNIYNIHILKIED